VKALFITNNRDGSSWYRVMQPGRKLAELGLVDCRVSRTGDLALEPENLAWADVILMGRIRGRQFLNMVKELHGLGKAVVYDADDDLLNTSPLNDRYVFFGTEEVAVKFPDGSTQILWADLAKQDQYPDLEPGRFVDIESNQKDAEALKQALGLVDAITVTTKELAKRFSDYGTPVHILPNCLDFNVWKPLDLRRPHDRVCMGWAGGASHFEDFNLIKGPLNRVMEDPRVHLWIQGTHFGAVTKDLDPDRVMTWGWVDCEAHAWRSAALAPDLAVIPLKDSPFSRRKSPIKWAEYAALGVPAICSDLPPYRDVVIHGVNGILAESPEAWDYFLDRLINDPLYRAKLGGRALETCRALFDADQNAHLWAEALHSALKGAKRRAA
jgi:glycosyltransferase involved in cell wall biosynthesis